MGAPSLTEVGSMMTFETVCPFDVSGSFEVTVELHNSASGQFGSAVSYYLG